MPQFPDRDAMTPDERAANAAAVSYLTRGKIYRFNPPATGTGFPTCGPNIYAPTELTFDRGRYVGFSEEMHMFLGTPINDQRDIPVPAGPGYDEDDLFLEATLKQLRQCLFHVLFIGGSTAVLDKDQRD